MLNQWLEVNSLKRVKQANISATSYMLLFVVDQ
jgi:hypothetical protein